MKSKSSNNEFDVIVIGSGMGGMTTATALSRMEHKVLLLEKAQTIGGLTHTFSRNGFSWDVGLHYCGMFGHDEPGDKVLDWLSGETVEFQSIGTVYDTIHFPDGFEIAVGRPAEAYKTELKERFPDNAAEIDAYFEALVSGEEAVRLVSAERSLPKPLRSAHRRWNKKKIERWCGRTTSEVIGVHFRSQACCCPVSSVGNVWWHTGTIKLRDSRANHPTLSRGSRLSRWWCGLHCGRTRTRDRIGRR
jgi:all-trans-retinol 13,14-reductase